MTLEAVNLDDGSTEIFVNYYFLSAASFSCLLQASGIRALLEGNLATNAEFLFRVGRNSIRNIDVRNRKCFS